MEWEFVDLRPGALEGALLVVGVPVLRNVAPIATELLIRPSSRKLVGVIDSEALPPVAMSYDGVVSSPIQIWSLPLPCGPNASCTSLAVVNSDIRVAPADITSLSGALARAAAERKVDLAVSLESTDVGELEGTLVSTNVYAEGALDGLSLGRLHGVHAGFNSGFLARATAAKLAAGGIYTASAGGPEDDARAAVELLRGLRPFLPADLLEEDLLPAAIDAAQRIARRRGEHQERERSFRDESDASYA